MNGTLNVIINADDCGRNAVVNAEIERCILAGRITSTTVMANWNDLAGAKKLYDKYKHEISFGAHLSLDEGKPMLFNQVLADNKIIEKIDGEWYFTRELWKHKILSSKVRHAIIEECSAQIKYLLENGFEISHLDSHHHVHTTIALVWLMPILCKRFNIKKYRRVRNCMNPGFRFYTRQIWNILQQIQMKGYLTTDIFGSYNDIVNSTNLSFLDKVNSIEIMCHPGHPGEKYKREVDSLLSAKQMLNGCNVHLVNYNQL